MALSRNKTSVDHSGIKINAYEGLVTELRDVLVKTKSELITYVKEIGIKPGTKWTHGAILLAFLEKRVEKLK